MVPSQEMSFTVEQVMPAWRSEKVSNVGERYHAIANCPENLHGELVPHCHVAWWVHGIEMKDKWVDVLG